MNLKTLLAVVLSAPLTAAAFDNGVDVAAALSEARASAKSDSYNADGRDHEVDCRDIVVPLERDAMRSVGLESYDLADCGERNGSGRYGRDSGSQYCSGGDRRTGVRHHASPAVSIHGAVDAKPWETLRFQACLDGTYVSVSPRKENPFSVTFSQVGSSSNGWLWIGTTGARVSEQTDPAGVKAEFVFNDAGDHATVVFVDRWASHYGKVQVRYHVKHERNNLRDEGVSGSGGVMTSSERPLTYHRAFPIQAGENYFIEYAIRREGSAKFEKTQRVAMPAPAARLKGLEFKRDELCEVTYAGERSRCITSYPTAPY